MENRPLDALVLKQLRKVYANGLEALKSIDLIVEEGDFFALLGPNGAGKTTTLRMLYSLLPPDPGEIRLDGLDHGQAAMEIKRTLGVVPDSRGLYSRRRFLFFSHALPANLIGAKFLLAVG